jgi:hypothetical protein
VVASGFVNMTDGRCTVWNVVVLDCVFTENTNTSAENVVTDIANTEGRRTSVLIVVLECVCTGM